MDIDQIKANLCCYDNRNTFYTYITNNGEFEQQLPCNCDNCFYGQGFFYHNNKDFLLFHQYPYYLLCFVMNIFPHSYNYYIVLREFLCFYKENPSNY
jgi:hypothetical protein